MSGSRRKAIQRELTAALGAKPTKRDMRIAKLMFKHAKWVKS